MVLKRRDAFQVIIRTAHLLEKRRRKATPKIIRAYASSRFAGFTPKIIEQIPKFLRNGVSLGLLKRVNKNYRTDNYVLRENFAQRREKREGRAKLEKFLRKRTSKPVKAKKKVRRSRRKKELFTCGSPK